jgi:hypothetical protein
MKASHDDGDPSGSERSCNVESAGILIRLNSYERNTSQIVVTSKAGKERRDIDACVRLVDDLDVDGDVRPKHPPLGAIGWMPYTAASEFEGVIARHHRITYPSSS